MQDCEGFWLPEYLEKGGQTVEEGSKEVEGREQGEQDTNERVLDEPQDDC